MKSLEMHDSQIIYMLYLFMKRKMNIVLHKGDLHGKYFLCSLVINGINKINETDLEGLNDLIDNRAVVYDIQIQELESKVVIEITGPDFWNYAIEAKSYEYTEKEVPEKDLEAFFKRDFHVENEYF